MVKGFERYGLSGNPFHDLASENIDDIEIFHVQQEIDFELDSLQEDIVDLENQSVISILGGLGAGKTQRLQLALSRAEDDGVFSIYNSLNLDTRWIIKEITNSFLEGSDVGMLGGLSGPRWYKELNKVDRQIEKKGYHSDKVGMAIAQALNDNRPSFLLLNDLHHIRKSKDITKFMETLYVIFNNIDDGVMVMLGSDLKFYYMITKKFPSIKQRINNVYEVPSLSDEEASLLLAKRMLAKRLVEDLDPTYPFTDVAISKLNRWAKGTPRRLLKLSDKVLDFAADQKAIKIDKELVRTVYRLEREKKEQRKKRMAKRQKSKKKKSDRRKSKNGSKSKTKIKKKKPKKKTKGKTMLKKKNDIAHIFIPFSIDFIFYCFRISAIQKLP